MLQECVNNIWFYLHVYLILIVSACRLCDNINKKNCFNILKKKRIIKVIADYCRNKEIAKKSLIHSPSLPKGYTNTIKTLAGITQKLRMSFENEILRSCLFLWDALSENKLEPR